MTQYGTLSTKGQITIPVEIRKRLGLNEGDRVEFVVRGDDTVIRPAAKTDNPFAKYRGVFAENSPGDIEAIVREERFGRGRATDSSK